MLLVLSSYSCYELFRKDTNFQKVKHFMHAMHNLCTNGLYPVVPQQEILQSCTLNRRIFGDLIEDVLKSHNMCNECTYVIVYCRSIFGQT